MKNEQAQRRIIAAALFSTYSSALIPSTYEQLLAEKYITGTITIRHAIELLEDYKLKQVATCPLSLGKFHVAA
ncbi:MAG: hypothetical protein EOO61_17645 [Hymenobacter sp.]|nr:MAG: hypothetical protein EOO61_17645 [Hymenobacter sp.]